MVFRHKCWCDLQVVRRVTQSSCNVRRGFYNPAIKDLNLYNAATEKPGEENGIKYVPERAPRHASQSLQLSEIKILNGPGISKSRYAGWISFGCSAFSSFVPAD